MAIDDRESPAASAETAPDAAAQIAARLDTNLLWRIVIIGCGGIGLWLTRSVATLLVGLAQARPERFELCLVDGDSYAPENTYRMDVPGLGNKAVALGHELLERCEQPNLAIRWVPQFVVPENVVQLVREGDCVLLAVDNHATRQLVGRHAMALSNITLISGGNDGVDEQTSGTYGNVQVHVRRDGCDLTAPLERYHPEIAEPADSSPAQLDCLELAAAGVPQLSFVNLAVASAMCNALLRLLMPPPGQPMYDEVALDILEATSVPLWLSAGRAIPGSQP